MVSRSTAIIVNDGTATARDVLTLIDMIKSRAGRSGH